MGYNAAMRRITRFIDAVRLIRFVAYLWIVYLIVLVIINQVLGSPRQPGLLFYILHAAVALVCLGLASWPWIQERLKHAFIPLIIAISILSPFAINWLTGQLSGGGPGGDNAFLNPFPFFFLGLLLVVWQYRWPYILLVIAAIAGLNLGVMWSFSSPRDIPFRGAINMTLIQTVIFLAVGFSISYLMDRLKRQQQSLETANANLTHYASTLEQLSISQERNRLARELHDTLAHSLSALSVQLETIKAYWDVDPPAARAILDQSLKSAHSGLEETRRALKALRASTLEDLGLSRAIANLAKDAASRGGLALEISIPDKVPALSPDIEQCVFRVAQEAIHNVVNHAKASKLMVNLNYADGKVILEVQDNGTGFDTAEIDKAGHFGLMGVRERAGLVGGDLSIVSQPGSGTTIRLTA
jgi:signal transduction histidine kinase